MKLMTRHFGEVEIDDTKIIDFEESLPGFSAEKSFIILKENEDEPEDGLFCWLQSVTNGDVAFALMNVIILLPDYNPLVDDEELVSLGSYDSLDDLIIFNVTVIPEDINNMTVNLRAPIVVNTKTKKGKQVIANNDEYDVRHYIFEELKNKK